MSGKNRKARLHPNRSRITIFNSVMHLTHGVRNLRLTVLSGRYREVGRVMSLGHYSFLIDKEISKNLILS